MKRPAGEHDNSLEDTKNDSEKRPRMEQDRIARHGLYSFGSSIFPDPNAVAIPRPPSPPLQDYDRPNHTNDTVHGMDAPIFRTIENPRNHRPPSPAPSDAPTLVDDDVSSITDSNPESPPQSPTTRTTCFDVDYTSIEPRSLSAERTSSPLAVYSESCSESPPCSLSPEKSVVHPLFEPNFTSAVAEKTPSPSPMDILHSKMSSYMEPNALESFEEQSPAMENTVLPSRKERTGWFLSRDISDIAPHGSLETSPDHHTEEGYPATDTICKDSSSSDVDDDSILPEFDVQKPSKIQTMYTAMEIEPSDFGVNNTTITSLPECIRTRIMTFCIEPKDLFALISSSPVFLQPFCQNRRAIVSRIIKHMRFRFGGDMPRSCLMVARLRNIESKGAASNPEVRRATAKRAIRTILSDSPKGPLLHPVYSLRHLKFISDTLDKAESVMTSYAYLAWANINDDSKLGPSHTTEDLVLFRTERKRFMDAICLYDAYCTAFFSENAISSDDDIALRQSFLEEDGIPSEIIKRFYSITSYLHEAYQYWIYIAIGRGRRVITAMGENSSLFPSLEKRIDLLVNHFVCSGPGVFRLLRDMEASKRYDLILRQLDRCETDPAYFHKITSAQGRGDKQLWAYREFAGGLTMQEVQTAQNFWDSTVVWRIRGASSIRPTIECPTVELQL
ncbi:hypothetical protein FMUND_2920 [Fusarium mundagurra]|uniref:Uncharacterized protein n=1 Tax=Fusarium mundagurra TaxID=1567541 RepID=A0A8H5Z0L8_9HYPO|nr:hypothetical protein FMUND_2920 [Fusarium mundagurra]